MSSQLEMREKKTFKKRLHRPWNPTVLELIPDTQLTSEQSEPELSLVDMTEENENMIWVGGFLRPKGIVFSNELDNKQTRKALIAAEKAKSEAFERAAFAEDALMKTQDALLKEEAYRKGAEDRADSAIKQAQLAIENSKQLEMKLEKAENIIAQLEHAKIELKESMYRLEQEKMMAKDSEILELCEKIAELQSINEQLENQISESIEHIQNKETMHRLEQEKVMVKDAEISKLNEKAYVLESINKQLEDRISDSIGQIKNLEAEMKALPNVALEGKLKESVDYLKKMELIASKERDLREHYEEKYKMVSSQLELLESYYIDETPQQKQPVIEKWDASVIELIEPLEEKKQGILARILNKIFYPITFLKNKFRRKKTNYLLTYR